MSAGPVGAPEPAHLPGVEAILLRIVDPDERGPIEAFFTEAAKTLAHLAALEDAVASLETKVGSRRLWSMIEPQFTSAMREVQEFLSKVATLFDIPEDDDADADASASEAPRRPRPVTDSHVKAAFVIEAIRGNLAHDLPAMRSSLEHFARAENRWELLDKLGEFRGKARAAIGEMIFVVARLFAVVRKQDVVPFYVTLTQSSLQLRRQLGEFRQGTTPINATLNEPDVWKDEPRAREALEALAKEIDVFLGSVAYQQMRGGDQRAFFEVRRDLALAIADSEFDAAKLDRTVEGFGRFADSMLLINRREELILHDRELTEALRQRASVAKGNVAAGRLPEVRSDVLALLEQAEGLFGRDPTLDTQLVELRVADLNVMEAGAFSTLLKTLLECVEASSPQPGY